MLHGPVLSHQPNRHHDRRFMTKPDFYRAVYTAFDPHPSSKGASTHITHFYHALRNYEPQSALLSIAGTPDAVPDYPQDYFPFHSEEPNYLRRGTQFSQWVRAFLDAQPDLRLGHFRDVWGGMAILNFPHIRPVFEVNGFPSVELPYRYPQVAPETLHKLRELENHCLSGAAQLVCPSETIKRHILSRGVTRAEIKVIPNGADPAPMHPAPAGLPAQYFLYQGALQPWQGVDILLKALRYLDDLAHIPLVICSAHKAKLSRKLHKLAEKMGLQDRIFWRYQVAKPELQQLMQHALFTVAPLTECSRNLEQGCSPLKVFESMACGTPVIASDLPVVREIITPEHDGLLFRPGRPADLARAMRLLTEYADLRHTLGSNARQTIATRFTWKQQKEKLLQVYRSPITESLTL